MYSQGYWVSPDGELVEVPTSHIEYVLRSNDKFGFSIKELRRRYSDHGERLGLEGVARSEILSAVLEQGWIRLRFRKEDLVVQAKISVIRRSKFLAIHVQMFLGTGQLFSESPVVFLDQAGRQIASVMAGKLIQEWDSALKEAFCEDEQ